MRAGDDQQLAAVLADSHTVRCEVTPYYDGEPATDFGLPIESGSITWDAGQAIQGALSVTLPRVLTDPDTGQFLDLLPLADDAPLAANGQQLAVRYVVGGHGDEIAVDLGWFRIDAWDEDTDAGTITVTGSSLEALIADSRFLYTRKVAAGLTFAQAAAQLVGGLLPLQVDADPARVVANRIYEEDRLEALLDLVRAWPARMFVDDQGTLRIVEPGDGEYFLPVTTLRGGEGGTVVQTPRNGSREAIYNAVKASGEADGDTAPVVAIAYLAAGPRRWDGPFGRVPYFYSSPLLTTVTQAQNAARTRLETLQARALPIVVTAAPDPRLQVGDHVEVHYEDGAIAVVLDTITLPLTADGGAMSLTGHVRGLAVEVA